MSRSSRIKVIVTAASAVRASTRPGAPGLGERAHAVPRLVRATLAGTYAGTTRRRLGMAAAAFVYVASPLDLLPEAFLPVVGVADDALVISWALRVFVEETDRFLAWEQGQGLYRQASTGWGTRTVTRNKTRNETRHETRNETRAGWSPVVVADSTAMTTGSTGSTDPVATGPAATTQGRVAASARAAAGSATGAVREAATTYVLESVRKRLER